MADDAQGRSRVDRGAAGGQGLHACEDEASLRRGKAVRRYLLDTNAASDCIFRRKGVDERVKQERVAGNRIGIGMPVLGELFGGVEYSSTREKNLDILLRNLKLFALWPFTFEAAQQYGKIFADLRRRGHPIQQIDMQIAAIALSLGNCTVVSSDSDFKEVKGLLVENWTVSESVAKKRSGRKK